MYMRAVSATFLPTFSMLVTAKKHTARSVLKKRGASRHKHSKQETAKPGLAKPGLAKPGLAKPGHHTIPLM